MNDEQKPTQEPEQAGSECSAGLGALTGEDVLRAMRDAERARSDERERRMTEYDETIYRPSMKAIRDRCPHDKVSGWLRNGIGWSWKECQWCGHRTESAPTDEVGGQLYGFR